MIFAGINMSLALALGIYTLHFHEDWQMRTDYYFYILLCMFYSVIAWYIAAFVVRVRIYFRSPWLLELKGNLKYASYNPLTGTDAICIKWITFTDLCICL